MKQGKDLERKIDDIKYDIETLEMEKTGLIRKLRFLKEKLIINFVILILIFLFLMFTVGYDPYEPYSIAFTTVLRPLYFLLTGVYIFFLILKPIWGIYLNCNLKAGRKAAIKYGVKSISENIEMCDIRISALNSILRDYEETAMDGESMIENH